MHAVRRGYNANMSVRDVPEQYRDGVEYLMQWRVYANKSGLSGFQWER